MDLTKILAFTLLVAIVVRSEAQAAEITGPNANEVITKTSVTTTETTTTIQELEGVFRLIQTIKTSRKGQISKKTQEGTWYPSTGQKVYKYQALTRQLQFGATLKRCLALNARMWDAHPRQIKDKPEAQKNKNIGSP